MSWSAATSAWSARTRSSCRWNRPLISLILALAAQLPANAPAVTRLPPVEQCNADPTFNPFRNRLRRIIARKDETALTALLADDVLVDFGGGNGRRAFASTWEFGGTGTSRVWSKLVGALAFGCAPAGDALVAPSFIALLPAEADRLETMVAIPLTRLRTAPNDLAPGLGNLDWDMLEVTDAGDSLWVAVSLADGRKGYVRREQLVSVADYRLTFEKKSDGQWAVTSFVAGD